MSANIISSVTTVSALATRRPSLFRTSRAERPPGTICNPGPYAEMSTVEPGVSPNASRSCLGTKMRPPESITASMGPWYQRNPIFGFVLFRNGSLDKVERLVSVSG